MRTNNFGVRVCPAERQAVLESFASSKGVDQKEFVYVWQKWGYWAKSPPAVAEIDSRIVGFVAVAFLKKDYANLYYISVLPECRCEGVGSQLLSFVYAQMFTKNLVRLKLKAVVGSIGDQYWQSKGMCLVGADKKHHYYDSFVEANSGGAKLANRVMPVYMREKYKRAGVVLL